MLRSKPKKCVAFKQHRNVLRFFAVAQKLPRKQNGRDALEHMLLKNGNWKIASNRRIFRNSELIFG